MQTSGSGHGDQPDLIGSAPGLSAATDLEALRDEWRA
jgi:hypothetical protein